MEEGKTPLPRYWIGVYELDDVVPRRDPRKPNLLVAKTVSPPAARFEVMRRGTRKQWFTNHLVKARIDLSPSKSYSTREAAEQAQLRLVRKLKRQGYTVNRDTTTWTVYVVELDPSGTTDPKRGFLYVGETSLSPEERLAQHQRGAHNKHGRLYSPVVKKYGIKLRPDLSPKRRYFDSVSAKQAEKDLFDKLKARNYEVRGGH